MSLILLSGKDCQCCFLIVSTGFVALHGGQRQWSPRSHSAQQLHASDYIYHYSHIVYNILRQMIYYIKFVLAITICHLGFVAGVAREAGCVHHIRSTQHHFPFGTFLTSRSQLGSPHSCTIFIMSLILIPGQDCQCCILIITISIVYNMLPELNCCIHQ